MGQSVSVRRHVLAALFGFVASASLCSPSSAAPSPSKRAPIAKRRRRPADGRARSGLLTEASAVDRVSRELLRSAPTKLWQGAPQGADMSPYIHRNFSWIIDSNLARLGPARCSRLIESLSERETHNLAALYWSSTTANGREPLALDVLANRLKPGLLAKLSSAFGFGPVYAAVARTAPHKVSEFAAIADTQSMAQYAVTGTPLPGNVLASRVGAPSATPTNGPGIFLDYTPEMIYLAFRTAPVGSLSISASLFSTGVVVAGMLTLSWDAGYRAGTILTMGLQYFAPSAWQLIVNSVGQWMYDFGQAWNGGAPGIPAITSPEESGAYQEAGAQAFEIEEWAYLDFAETGGDYDVCMDWANLPDGPEVDPDCGKNMVECQDGSRARR
jgi:hypothetical protein